MANLNKVMLIGRLTRDPEKIELRGSIAGAKCGFAVNNRKLNNDTQKWEDVPVFIDVEIWNRGESKQAERFFQTVKKGQQVFLEGHLKMDQWEDKNGGGKRSKLLVVVENFQYLEAKDGGGGSGGGDYGEAPARSFRPAAAPARSNGPARGPAPASNYDDDMGAPPSRSGSGAGSDEDIPF